MSYSVHPVRECRNCAYFRPTAGRGLCGSCYRRSREGWIARELALPLEERFWGRVQKGPDCWIWMGPRLSRNPARAYGHLWANGRNRIASQVAWELANGEPFPARRGACHTCDNPSCVRPDHIFPGTQQDNARDAEAKGRLYHPPHEFCIHGHRMDAENAYVRKDGGRNCKACGQNRQREARKRVAV